MKERRNNYIARKTMLFQQLKKDQATASRLTDKQRKKCRQKFDQIKSMGNLMISKQQISKIMQEKKLEMAEEQILQMLYQGDAKGQGYISYEAFQQIVERYKKKRQNDIGSTLKLTFDSIIELQRQKQQNCNLQTISNSFFQKYFAENFGLNINLESLKIGTTNGNLTKENFKNMFS